MDGVPVLTGGIGSLQITPTHALIEACFVHKQITSNVNNNNEDLSAEGGEKQPLVTCIVNALWDLFVPDEIDMVQSYLGMTPQSGMESDVMPDAAMHQENDTQTHENVTFMDKNASYAYDLDSEIDSTRRLQDTDDTELGDFFARPVKVASFSWNTAGSLVEEVDPWSAFFENPRVVNRIANYNLMRTKLKVKVVINGNGFYYGKAMMVYQPLYLEDELSGTTTQADLVQLSQLPRVFIDPCTSTGGEMTLPFFFYKNYMRIPDSDWNGMGRLLLRSFTPLKHANGATGTVTINVFAWTEDIELSVLTSEEPTSLTPQMGKEVDEANAKGTVSGPATALAKIANAMKGVPYIGPYATATAIAATATARVAKMFGYSRPPVTRAPEPVRPTANASLAVCNVPDHCQKLTVDSNQELTIDPRITGLSGADPLSILDIAKRESYLTTFSWNPAAGSGAHLWNTRVTPVLWRERTSNGELLLSLPACAVATMPFKYWTGTIHFRFQLMASAYHKGRLQIKYDPNHNRDNEFNVNYMKLIDIADEQDFTISVSNAQDITLLEHGFPGLNAVDSLYNTDEFGYDVSESNGTLGVYVLNQLTTPNDTVDNTIAINVYISVGDDFEVFAPDGDIGSYRANVKPQMGAEVPDDLPDDQDMPVQTHSYRLGTKPQVSDDICKVFAGEKICSFRTLLKRYNLHSVIPHGDAGTGAVEIYGTRPHFPMYRGYGAEAVHTTVDTHRYNYYNTVLLHWITLCFSGYRGSIRYKLLPDGRANGLDNILVTREALQHLAANYRNASRLMPWYTTDAAANRAVIPGAESAGPKIGFEGSAFALSAINGILEFESPYYSPYRFTPGKAGSQAPKRMLTEAAWNFNWKNNSDRTSNLNMFVAAGEDFQTYFWTGMPPLVFEAVPPAIQA